MIAIIDYHAGNIGSISNMIRKLGFESQVTNNKEVISRASKIILPGVGAFDWGMSKLEELDLLGILNKKVLVDKTPVLGICLGAQLMCRGSEEGIKPGMNWIEADVVKFKNEIKGKRYSVPHMGWDEVNRTKESAIFTGVASNQRFYFVHSYFIRCANPQDVLLKNTYGEEFDSAFEKDNIFGVQFHPEKSHKFGRQLLKNFVENY